MGLVIVGIGEKIFFLGGIGSNDDNLPTESLTKGSPLEMSTEKRDFDLGLAFASKVIRIPGELVTKRNIADPDTGTTLSTLRETRSGTLDIGKTTRPDHLLEDGLNLAGYTISQNAIQPIDPSSRWNATRNQASK